MNVSARTWRSQDQGLVLFPVRSAGQRCSDSAVLVEQTKILDIGCWPWSWATSSTSAFFSLESDFRLPFQSA